MRAPGGKKSVWAGSRARRWIGPHCNGSWACRAAISGLRSSRRAPLSTMPTHSEHDAVIDTIRERQRAVLNFPVQNSFSRGGSYSAVITRTRGACLPPSRAQPAPAQTARQGFKVPRARSEPFPNAAESGRKIEFLTVDAGFGPSWNVVST